MGLSSQKGFRSSVVELPTWRALYCPTRITIPAEIPKNLFMTGISPPSLGIDAGPVLRCIHRYIQADCGAAARDLKIS